MRWADCVEKVESATSAKFLQKSAYRLAQEFRSAADVGCRYLIETSYVPGRKDSKPVRVNHNRARAATINARATNPTAVK